MKQDLNVELVKEHRRFWINYAVEHGFSEADAERQLNSLIAGNTGTFTAAFRSMIEEYDD